MLADLRVGYPTLRSPSGSRLPKKRVHGQVLIDKSIRTMVRFLNDLTRKINFPYYLLLCNY